MIKIFYDVETTGTDYRKHSIIQLSGVIEINNGIVEDFDYNVKPHPKAKIEDSAFHVNGKTIEDIYSYPEMSKIHSKFTKLLSKYIDKFNPKQKAWLVGFNNRAFDDKFLRMFFELCGDKFIGYWFWADTIDVICLASQYLLARRSNMPSFKLKRVALELGIPVEKSELHDAMYHVKLTREIYRIITGLEIEI